MENVVLFQLSAEREIAAFRRNRFHFVDKLSLLFEQCVARIAIFLAFVWIPQFTHVDHLFGIVIRTRRITKTEIGVQKYMPDTGLSIA